MSHLDLAVWHAVMPDIAPLHRGASPIAGSLRASASAPFYALMRGRRNSSPGPIQRPCLRQHTSASPTMPCRPPSPPAPDRSMPSATKRCYAQDREQRAAQCEISTRSLGLTGSMPKQRRRNSCPSLGLSAELPALASQLGNIYPIFLEESGGGGAREAVPALSASVCDSRPTILPTDRRSLLSPSINRDGRLTEAHGLATGFLKTSPFAPSIDRSGNFTCT